MSLALLRKELREHGLVLGAVLLLDALGLASILNDAARHGGRFTGLQRFFAIFGTLTAVVLGNRLVVREYTGRTQLFLEALPLSRARVLLTKWLLGAFALLGVAASAVALNLWWQSSERIEAIDAARAFSRGALFLLCVWAFCFLAGLLGRVRLAAWLLVGSFYGASNTMGFDATRLPPATLVGEALGLSRAWPSGAELATTLAVVAVGLLGAAALALLKEGALAQALGQKASSREFVFILTSFVGLGVLADQLKAERKQPPFALQGAATVDTPLVPVAVMPTGDFPEEEAQALAERLAARFEGLGEALELPRQSGAWVLPQSGLDREVTLRGALSDSDGIVLQANVAAPSFEVPMLQAEFVHALLAEHTRNRALREDRHWFLDGFSHWWVARGDPDRLALQVQRAAATPEPITAAQLTRWEETEDALGDALSSARAHLVLEALARSRGEAAVLALARSAFQRPQGDARAWLFDRGLEGLLAREGLNLVGLAADAEALRQHGAAEPFAGTATLSQRALGGRQVELSVSLEGLPPGAPWRAFLLQLQPWEGAVLPERRQRFDAFTPQLVLPVPVSSGDRVLVQVELDDEALGCARRVFSQRVDIL